MKLIDTFIKENDYSNISIQKDTEIVLLHDILEKFYNLVKCTGKCKKFSDNLKSENKQLEFNFDKK